MDDDDPPEGGGINNWIENSVLKDMIKNLEDMCEDMRKEIDSLKAENSQLKMQDGSKALHSKNIDHQYETDEEELAAETEWILKKNSSKKRKASKSPEVVNKPAKKASKTGSLNNNAVQKNTRPPPIMVSNIDNYIDFNEMLKKSANSGFTIKLLNNKTYKVSVTNSDDYRSVTKNLNLFGISWYSFENVQSRPIKVIVKNLHHSWDPAEIIGDLKQQNLNAIAATQKLKFKTKEPLDMFLISFDSSENIQRIYGIKTILNSVVKIEPPKRSTLIPQCKLCQSFGHTRNYCGKQARCVKCAGKHLTVDCKKHQKNHLNALTALKITLLIIEVA